MDNFGRALVDDVLGRLEEVRMAALERATLFGNSPYYCTVRILHFSYLRQGCAFMSGTRCMGRRSMERQHSLYRAIPYVKRSFIWKSRFELSEDHYEEYQHTWKGSRLLKNKYNTSPASRIYFNGLHSCKIQYRERQKFDIILRRTRMQQCTAKHTPLQQHAKDYMTKI